MMVMLWLSVWLLLLVPLSLSDAPSIPSNDPISEEEYDAIKILWEEKHKEIIHHEEAKRSRLKPSYNEDTSSHQLDVIDVMKLTSSHHQTSHDQVAGERTHRQVVSTDAPSHVGSGSGDMRCDDPPLPANGDYVTNTTTVIYMCEEGFVLLGNQYRSCDFTTWTWNGTDPTCEVDCDFTLSVDCSDQVTKYYYNSTTQLCQQIVACDGPGNLFNSLEDCNQECPGPCAQDAPYNGSCDSRTQVFYYHIFEDRCYPFSEGCLAVRGNENSFSTLQDCLNTCRRSCSGTDTEGTERLHRAAWVTSDCRTCQCVNGLVSCQPMDLAECPTLFCGEDDPVTLVEGCCPVCPTESCNATEQTVGITRVHNETWTTSDCEQCQCTNGRVTCSPPNTPSPDCDPISDCSGEIIISNATMCCPVCIDTACEKDGVTYSDGESFMEDLCTTCQCIQGQINCTTKMCPQCSEGTNAFKVTGQCCPECRPALGACELMPQEPEILSLFNGVCNSVAPVALNECPEQCSEDNVVHCCIPLTDPRATDFECINSPGFPITLKYIDVTDCNCSPCG